MRTLKIPFARPPQPAQTPKIPATVPQRQWNLVPVMLWIALLLCMAGLWLRHRGAFQFGWFQDDVDYLMLSRSLFGGRVYGLCFTVPDVVPSQFPFGFPLVLSLVGGVMPSSVDALRAVSLVATLASVSLLFWGGPLLLNGRSRWLSLAVAALFGLTPVSVEFTQWVMSEPTFTAWLLLVLWVTERGRRTPFAGWPVALGVALFFAAFTRSIGWLLPPFTFAYLLYYRRAAAVRPLAVAAATMAASLCLVVALTSVTWRDVLPLQYLNLYRRDARNIQRASSGDAAKAPPPEKHAGVAGRDDLPFARAVLAGLHILPDTYVGYCILAAESHVENELLNVVLPVNPQTIRGFFTRVRLPWVPLLLGWAVGALILAGYLRGIRRDGLTAFWGFGLLYLAVTTVWLWAGLRFLYPVLPQLLLAFVFGVEGVIRMLARTRTPVAPVPGLSRPVMASLVVLAITVFGAKSYALRGTRHFWGDLRNRVSWSRVNLPENAVVFSSLPRADWYYSGRRGVEFPQTTTTEAEVRSVLQQKGVTHVLIAPDEVFSDPYQPAYDATTKQIQRMLPALTADGTLKPVPTAGTEQIAVYRVAGTPRHERSVSASEAVAP